MHISLKSVDEYKSIVGRQDQDEKLVLGEGDSAATSDAGCQGRIPLLALGPNQDDNSCPSSSLTSDNLFGLLASKPKSKASYPLELRWKGLMLIQTINLTLEMSKPSPQVLMY